MYAQRWDSYEQPREVFNAIIYADESGKRLLAQQPGDTVKSMSQYVSLIVSRPTIMIPLLVRHVIDGLDVRYTTIYVERFASGGICGREWQASCSYSSRWCVFSGRRPGAASASFAGVTR